MERQLDEFSEQICRLFAEELKANRLRLGILADTPPLRHD